MVSCSVNWLRFKANGLLPTNSMRLRLGVATFWALTGSIAAQGLTILASVVTARMLGKSSFGEFGIVLSTVNTLSVFAVSGMGITATKYVAQLRTTDPERVGRILGLARLSASIVGGLISLVLFATAGILASRTLNAPQLADELRLATAFLFINVLIATQIGTLSGFENFKLVATLNLIRSILSFILTVVGVVLFGLMGAIAAMVLSGLAGWWLNERAVRRECAAGGITISRRGMSKELRILSSFSLPAFLSAVLVAVATWLANTMLVNQPNGYDEMGLFNAANQWRLAILFVPTVVGQVTLPILANLFGMGEVERYRKTLWFNLAAVACVCVVIATPILALSPWIMSLYGTEFTTGSAILVMVTCGTILAALAGVVGSALSSQGKMWPGFWLNLIWAVGFVILTYVFVNEGGRGIARAYLLSYLLHFALSAICAPMLLRNLRAASDASSKLSEWSDRGLG